ncbi:hypothetical protein L1D31_18050 [Vibrio sp. Isolate23]|uniref:hypothetical protein n=1 Tax=Vibrio sp. Isolate23 TaxID=2908533 RepID=UPI001EFC508B|nr:hypothetical protein [Vibrio sp. Isolate23]MCG9684441.1 hypothetical protein [Vibrio sp. Isolate23]
MTTNQPNVDIFSITKRLAISQNELDDLLQESVLSATTMGVDVGYALNFGYSAPVRKYKPTEDSLQWRLTRNKVDIDEATVQRMECLLLLHRQTKLSYRELDDLFAIGTQLPVDSEGELGSLAYLYSWQKAGVSYTNWFNLVQGGMKATHATLLEHAIAPCFQVDFTQLIVLLSAAGIPLTSFNRLNRVVLFLEWVREQGISLSWLIMVVTPGESLPLELTEELKSKILDWRRAMDSALVEESELRSVSDRENERLLQQLDKQLAPLDWSSACREQNWIDEHGLVALPMSEISEASLSDYYQNHATVKALKALKADSELAQELLERIWIEMQAAESYVKGQASKQQQNLDHFILNGELLEDASPLLLAWIGLESYGLMCDLLQLPLESDDAFAGSGKSMSPDIDGAKVQQTLLAHLYDIHRHMELLKRCAAPLSFMKPIIASPQKLHPSLTSKLSLEWVFYLLSLEAIFMSSSNSQVELWTTAIEKSFPKELLAHLMSCEESTLNVLIEQLSSHTESTTSMVQCIQISQVINLAKSLQIPVARLVDIYTARNGQAQDVANQLRQDIMKIGQ